VVLGSEHLSEKWTERCKNHPVGSNDAGIDSAMNVNVSKQSTKFEKIKHTYALSSECRNYLHDFVKTWAKDYKTGQIGGQPYSDTYSLNVPCLSLVNMTLANKSKVQEPGLFIDV